MERRWGRCRLTNRKITDIFIISYCVRRTASSGRIRPKEVVQTMKRYRSLIVLILDIIILIFSDWLALAFRFDFLFSRIPKHYLETITRFLPIQIVLTIAIFALLRMYKFIWRSVTARDVAHMMIATIVAFAVNLVVHILILPRLPISVYCIMLILQLMLFAGMRSVFRFTSLITDS